MVKFKLKAKDIQYANMSCRNILKTSPWKIPGMGDYKQNTPGWLGGKTIMGTIR
jgi:hypothetical protein